MEESIVTASEGLAVILKGSGWHRRIVKPFMTFDAGRSFLSNIASCRVESVVETLLGDLAKFLGRWRRWRRSRRLVINRLGMSAPGQSKRQQ
jgi:hypothetical protein